MVRRHRCRAGVVAASVCGLVLACLASSLSAGEGEQKIRDALAKPTQIEFNETALKDVVTYFSELHAVNIQLHGKKLEEANVQVDTPITKVVKGVSFGSALNLLLEPLGLTYVIENQVLLITSPAYAQQSSAPRVYDLTGLAADSERETLLKAIELALDRPAIGDDGKPVPASSAASRAIIFRQKLILRGSQPEHDRVSELLLKLREPAKPTAAESATPRAQ